MSKPHIVILGAGFGGTYVAKKLVRYVKRGSVEITIVNRTNYFLFTPLLHEVATGALTPTSVAEPLREIFAGTGVRVVQAEVESIDRAARTVKLKGNGPAYTIPYDRLIIATGADTAYYGVPGAEKFTYPLKSLEDAVRIRSRVIDAFEEAMLTPDKAARARLLSFAVVGGGATGVETAAELAELIHGMVKRYYGATRDCDPSDHRTCKAEEPFISIVHMGPDLLPMFSPKLRTAAEKRLCDKGVAVRLNSTVTEVTANGLTLSTGTPITAGTVIWTAGVSPIIPHFSDRLPNLVGGRLSVDASFRVGGDPAVFAIGDVAAYIEPDKLAVDPKAKPVPLLAQSAVAQAPVVARNVIASLRDEPLRSFKYRSKGSMVSVGQWFALGDVFSLHMSGRFTWWLWRTVYLFKFASWKKRLRIAYEWTMELFYPRDITALRG